MLSLVEEANCGLPHPPLIDSRVVVVGGRGIGGKDGFAQLEALADLLGGVVGASRTAVELGWSPRDRMVDLAGSHIHPDLYVGVGISGSSSHRVALRGARCIVAINSDDSLCARKGFRRPAVAEDQRARLLAALSPL